MKQSTYYPINEEAAARAKSANSFSDYEPGSATAAYRVAVDKAVAIAVAQKEKVDPAYHEQIDRLLDSYSRKLAENMNNRFAIDARVPSILIAGGGNFPVRKKEKQNAARDKNLSEWQKLSGLIDKILSTGKGGISADDPYAIQKLKNKLENLEESQATMKAVNAYYRKHKSLDGCTFLPQEQLIEIKEELSRSTVSNPKPFATFMLSNNNAEIHRVKARIDELERNKNERFAGWQFDGGRVEANIDANRLQIFFEDKPDNLTRTELSKHGYRWAPSEKAWQRQLNRNAYFAANYVKAIRPQSGGRPSDLLQPLGK